MTQDKEDVWQAQERRGHFCPHSLMPNGFSFQQICFKLLLTSSFQVLLNASSERLHVLGSWQVAKPLPSWASSLLCPHQVLGRGKGSCIEKHFFKKSILEIQAISFLYFLPSYPFQNIVWAQKSINLLFRTIP